MHRRIRNEKIRKRYRRKLHIRNKIKGTAEVPRITIFRSNKHLAIQVIDDETGRTLCTVSTYDKAMNLKGNNKEVAKKIGEQLAGKMLSLNIKKAVFDRNGYLYHGKVASFVEALREKKIRI